MAILGPTPLQVFIIMLQSAIHAEANCGKTYYGFKISLVIQRVTTAIAVHYCNNHKSTKLC